MPSEIIFTDEELQLIRFGLGLMGHHDTDLYRKITNIIHDRG